MANPPSPAAIKLAREIHTQIKAHYPVDPEQTFARLIDAAVKPLVEIAQEYADCYLSGEIRPDLEAPLEKWRPPEPPPAPKHRGTIKVKLIPESVRTELELLRAVERAARELGGLPAAPLDLLWESDKWKAVAEALAALDRHREGEA